MNDYDEQWEVLADGVWVPLVRAVHPDACEYCLRGIDVGHDHPECVTIVPGSLVRY